MCGVVSLVYEGDTPSLGKEASELLKRLEYRGYDSTGASFITANKKITLVKKVGAPSKVTRELNIPQYGGQRFIGQVRWATYGAVTDINSQPHHVLCKKELVGAHNGNISNTDALKKRLIELGHSPKSDNDGEMLVHLIEEHYTQILQSGMDAGKNAHALFKQSSIHATLSLQHCAMIEAIRRAEAEAAGSYAACIADPDLEGVFAIKSGSSLYAGIGNDANGSFIVVSSDLSSVLSKTKTLIPLLEGQGIWYNHSTYAVFSLTGSLTFSEPVPLRSRLSVQDTGLHAPYKFFMHQEIESAPVNITELARYYFPDPDLAWLTKLASTYQAAEIIEIVENLAQTSNTDALQASAKVFFSSPQWLAFENRAKQAHSCAMNTHTAFISELAFILDELIRLTPEYKEALTLLDALAIERKRQEIRASYTRCIAIMQQTQKRKGTIYILASGTSYHAALIGSYFFGSLARLAVFPCNPGQFRGNYLSTLKPDDLIIAISQSGETKDLVDILQDAKKLEPKIKRIAIVNNENSRIPQELSDFYLPILCGPEIAVAATKSFINQLVVLYLLAGAWVKKDPELANDLRAIHNLLTDTISSAFTAIDAIAEKLYLVPSIHLLGTGLIGLAREGALKIREVVLNHAEGYDAAEFKHGPNTILGKNTVFSLDQLESLSASGKANLTGTELETLFKNYPLVFICPPDEHDKHITISQIHTHKIRGADIFLIAEPDHDLELAVTGVPAGYENRYTSSFIHVPVTDNKYYFVFGSAIVLQYLAFRMSVLKKARLDALHVEDHGVHPDAPKNVSKSITVD